MTGEGLFKDAAERTSATGVLASQALKAAILSREIQALTPVLPDQIQPASLDLRLGPKAYRIPASFLPGPEATVAEKLDRLSLYAFGLDEGAVLERGCVYVVPLQESLRLRWRTTAHANPKSSIGRLDIFARLITDRGLYFDRVAEQYRGPLYAEISPQSFSVRVRTGSRLLQLRLRRGSPQVSLAFHQRLQKDEQVISPLEAEGTEATAGARRRPRADSDLVDLGLPFTVDLAGSGDGSLIGYKARRFAGLIDVDRVGHYDPAEFWEPLHARPDRTLILEPGAFYILASKEAVTVPPDKAAEMLAYDTLVGEFRVHYAGFFDPGFGHAEAGGNGTRAVLEVRSHDIPFLIEDGQIVGRLIYEPLAERPDILYGKGVGSYQRQGLALAKHFRPWR